MTDWTSVISHLIPLVVAVCFITFSVIRALKQRAATARIEREILLARRPPPPPGGCGARRSSPLPPPPPQPPPAPRPPKKPTQPRYIVLAVPLEGVDPTGPNGQFTNKREAEVFARRLARNAPTSEVVVVRVKDEQYTLVIPPRDVPHIIAEGDQVRDEEEI